MALRYATLWHTCKFKGVGSSAFSICLVNCCPDGQEPGLLDPGKSELECLVLEKVKTTTQMLCPAGNYSLPPWEITDTYSLFFSFFFLSFPKMEKQSWLRFYKGFNEWPKLYLLPYVCCKFQHPCFKVWTCCFLKLCHKFSPSSPGAYKACLTSTSTVVL